MTAARRISGPGVIQSSRPSRRRRTSRIYDMYDSCTQDIWSRCDTIKQTIKKETDLEDLRHDMSQRTKDRIELDDPFWKTKFNTRSAKSRRPSRDWLRNIE